MKKILDNISFKNIQNLNKSFTKHFHNTYTLGNTMTNTNKNIFYFLMFLAMISWGASWVNVKILGYYINEYEMIFLRNFFTIITFAPILIISKKSFYINKKSLFLAFLVAFFMIGYLKCFFLGTKFGTASLGGALVTTMIPINTFIIMALFFGRKIERKDFFALFLGAIGVLTMLGVWSFSAKQIFSIENMYFLGASIFWPLLTIASSKATKTSPLTFMFYMYIIATFLILIFFKDNIILEYQKYDSLFWINLLSISVLATTFGTTIYFIGIEKLGTNEVSSFIFLVPIFAILLSALFLKENINLNIIIGVILTLSAVKILNNIKILKR